MVAGAELRQQGLVRSRQHNIVRSQLVLFVNFSGTLMGDRLLVGDGSLDVLLHTAVADSSSLSVHLRRFLGSLICQFVTRDINVCWDPLDSD